jgi:chromosome segregation ATPase
MLITIQMVLDQYAKEKQELEAKVEALKAELAAKTCECEYAKSLASNFRAKAEQYEDEAALHRGEAEKLQTLAAKFQGEADDADKKADYWESEHSSLQTYYNWLLDQMR